MRDRLFDDDVLSNGDYVNILIDCFKRSWEKVFQNNDVDIVLSDIGIGIFRIITDKDGNKIKDSESIPIENLPRSFMSYVYDDFGKQMRIFKKRREYENFINSVGTIVNCSYMPSSRDRVSVEGGGLGILKTSDIDRKTLSGKFPALLSEVKESLVDSQLFLDRCSNDFVIAIVKQCIPDCRDGNIICRAVGRILGEETNIIVQGIPSIPVIKTCLGFEGSHIKDIRNNLGSMERVRFIEWSDDYKTLVCNFFKGIVINDIVRDGLKCYIVTQNVPEAIGKKGIRIRLLRKLMEYFYINSDYKLIEPDESILTDDCVRCKDLQFFIYTPEEYKELSPSNLYTVASDISSNNTNAIYNALYSAEGKSIALKLENICFEESSVYDKDVIESCLTYFEKNFIPDIRKRYVDSGGDSDFFMKVKGIPSYVYFNFLDNGIKSADDCKKMSVQDLAERFNLSYQLCSSLMDL